MDARTGNYYISLIFAEGVENVMICVLLF